MNMVKDNKRKRVRRIAPLAIPGLALLASFVLFFSVAGMVRHAPDPAGLSDVVYKAEITDKFFLSRSGLPSFLDTVTGLSAREPWGRWSDSKEIQFNFKSRLPHKFTLTLLAAHVTQDNINKPFIVQAGTESETFQVSAEQSTASVSFTNVSDAYSIKIVVPQVRSPTPGPGVDPRQLGLGIGWMQISTE